MPDWKTAIRQRLASLKLSPPREAEIVEELSQHLEDLYDELLTDGATEAEARRAALAELSEVALLEQELRHTERPVQQEPAVLGAGRPNLIADLWQDLRFSVRSLRKQLLLSLIVIATLTLGIGTSAGIFAYFNAEILRPKLNKDFDSFVRLYSGYTTDPLHSANPAQTTLEDFLAYRDRAKSLRDLAAYMDFHASLGKDDTSEVRALFVTANFFSTYDLKQPLMGRLLLPEDEVPGSTVVVLSERLWRKRFESDPQIVGKAVTFNGQQVTVVGVTPNFPGMVNGAAAWFPYTLATYLKRGDNLLKPSEAAWLEVVGRLNHGFSYKDAAAELKLLASQQDRLHPGRITTITVTNGSAIQEPENRDTMIVAFSVLVIALISLVLIVCVNVTTLLLARAASRRQEIAVRLALGAGRLRLIRMLLTETFLLASIAGLASCYLAYSLPAVLDRWLANVRENAVPDYSLAPDWRVFGYLTVVTLMAGILAGLTPTLQSLKVNLSEMLKGHQRAVSGGRGSRLYAILVGTQVALSFLLLFGAGLFVNAAKQAASFEPGFETRQVLWTDVYTQSSLPGQRKWGVFHQTLSEQLNTLPGVQSIAFASVPPYQSGVHTSDVELPNQDRRRASINWVSASFFKTLGIPIVSGRALEDGDPPCLKGVCAVVVSQRLASEFWPGENPLGKMLRSARGVSFEIVGVARDLSMEKLGGNDDPMIYGKWNPEDGLFNSFVRFSGDGAALAGVVSTTIRKLEPELSIWRSQTIQARREEAIRSLSSTTQLIVILCAMAVLLAVVGIYGVVAFAVGQRKKEIGIRLALGAQKRDIYQAVLGSSGRPIVVGVLAGLALTVAAFSALAPQLRAVEFIINARDPVAYLTTAILLAAVALAAMLLPARRATRVDPMLVLRDE